MELNPFTMSDEELMRMVEQWELDGGIGTMCWTSPALSSLQGSSMSTPSEVRQGSVAFPFPTLAPSDSMKWIATSDSFAAQTNQEKIECTPNEDEGETPTAFVPRQPKPTRDPAKRKQQNRNAQRAHRDRQKKLIHDLWAEVHSLRSQNKQLLDLKYESHELKLTNWRLMREVEAMERIWVEAVRSG